jgi:hypothetical protein
MSNVLGGTEGKEGREEGVYHLGLSKALEVGNILLVFIPSPLVLGSERV